MIGTADEPRHGRLRAPVLALLALVPCMLNLPSARADDSRLQRGVAHCAKVGDEGARLACFDGLAAGLDTHRATTGSPPASISAGTEPDVIHDRIGRLEQRPYGEWVFHLDGGQVWTELEPGRHRYRDGQQVRIERTPLGGHMLSTDGGRATRVRRVE